MKLEASVQRLFHRYHADRLDTVRHADLVIATVLADGAMDDWDWLFRVYGWVAIRDWLRDPGRAEQLGPAMERLWTGIVLGTPRSTPQWAGGNHRRSVPPEALPPWWSPDWR